jgi:hypothetical protein
MYMKPSDGKKYVTFNGKSVQPMGQISLHAKGPEDHRNSLYTFDVIRDMPYDVIFGRKTIHKRKFATPNSNSDICPENRIECSGMHTSRIISFSLRKLTRTSF